MSNYTRRSSYWQGKDSLSDSDPEKIISGDDFDDEFELIETAINTKANIGDFQAVYPVGSIYMNASNSANPGTLLGFGTWTSIGAGRMLMGDDGATNTYEAGDTGGSADSVLISHTHTTTVTDPGHTHVIGVDDQVYSQGNFTSVGSFSYDSDSNPSGGGQYVKVRNAANNSDLETTGVTVSNSTEGTGSGTGENLPPYLVVYMWKRTA